MGFFICLPPLSAIGVTMCIIIPSLTPPRLIMDYKSMPFGPIRFLVGGTRLVQKILPELDPFVMMSYLTYTLSVHIKQLRLIAHCTSGQTRYSVFGCITICSILASRYYDTEAIRMHWIGFHVLAWMAIQCQDLGAFIILLVHRQVARLRGTRNRRKALILGKEESKKKEKEII